MYVIYPVDEFLSSWLIVSQDHHHQNNTGNNHPHTSHSSSNFTSHTSSNSNFNFQQSIPPTSFNTSSSPTNINNNFPHANNHLDLQDIVDEEEKQERILQFHQNLIATAFASRQEVKILENSSSSSTSLHATPRGGRPKRNFTFHSLTRATAKSGSELPHSTRLGKSIGINEHHVAPRLANLKAREGLKLSKVDEEECDVDDSFSLFIDQSFKGGGSKRKVKFASTPSSPSYLPKSSSSTSTPSSPSTPLVLSPPPKIFESNVEAQQKSSKTPTISVTSPEVQIFQQFSQNTEMNGSSSVTGSMLFSGMVGGGGGTGSVGNTGGGGGLSSNSNMDSISLRECTHPNVNEALKAHNSLSFKLIRVVSDFTQQLSQLHEQHSMDLRMLLENFRARNTDLRKERAPCNNQLFNLWENMIQEVEIDSQAHSDISSSLARQVARPLLEKTFCLKIQSRKVFAHRESFETVLSKNEALLANAYKDYNDACLLHIQQGNNASLAKYYEAHNTYVQQLRGTNAMLKTYHTETLPALLQELESVYNEVCRTLSDSVSQGSEILASKSKEKCKRYETLCTTCQNVNGLQDIIDFVKTLPAHTAQTYRIHVFKCPVHLMPQGPDAIESNQDLSHVPQLKEEVIVERSSGTSSRSKMDVLRKEISELENQMKLVQDTLDTIERIQQRSLESNLYNKVNELQEEISMKRFDVKVANLHLASLKAQRELYGPTKSEVREIPLKSGMSGVGNLGSGVNAGASGSSVALDEITSTNSSAGKGDKKIIMAAPSSMKTKWIKAFKSLKTPPSSPSPSKEDKKQKDKEIKEPFQVFENHIFQEYTYKKITPCDICSQILRGHTKQGLRCRMCKMNVHADCQEKVEKCQPKTRLLRRQKSTSELETRLTQLAEPPDEESSQGSSNHSQTKTQTSSTLKQQGEELDMTYQVLKEATGMKKPTTPGERAVGGGGSCGGGGGSSSGSGSGSHGSSQTLHSHHEMTPTRMGMGRSNPSVNVVPGTTSHSGSSTPGAPASMAAQIMSSHQTSSGNYAKQRRDSYVNRKSMSADAHGSSTPQKAALPPPRSISLTASPTPHSPRRRKLDLRMKSFSLDSPESTEHAQRRKYAHGSHSTSHSQYWKYGGLFGNGYYNGMIHSNSALSAVHNMEFNACPPCNEFSSAHVMPPNASPNYFAPSSPVHNRRALLSTRSIRMNSVELPDENDKSFSSASTSPCPSPQKPHRLLPTNLYVVLYNFKARHPDELDLRAGYKVTVIDTTDPDWWQGKCLGRTGYFPSKYVTKLHPGEKPLQVTHNLQVTDGGDNGLKLLRDQIVIQIGEDLDGMVTIRNGENKQGVCPIKYLQEV